MRVVRLEARAKVNLFLRIEGRRADGFHDIETVFHGISLADHVTVAPARGIVHVNERAENGTDFRPHSDGPAHALVRDIEPPAGAGAMIEVVKRIPIGAGLGGGSADAAAILIGLNELWCMRYSAADLAAVALRAGSDVPFFLAGGTQLGRGRGERLTPIEIPAHLHFVLGFSNRPLSTSDVYSRWDDDGPASTGGAEPLIEALAAGDHGAAGAALASDLDPVVCRLRPELAGAKKALVAAGALGAIVSGSGPTVFGLAASSGDARRIAARVQDRFDRTEVAASAASAVARLD